MSTQAWFFKDLKKLPEAVEAFAAALTEDPLLPRVSMAKAQIQTVLAADIDPYHTEAVATLDAMLNLLLQPCRRCESLGLDCTPIKKDGGPLIFSVQGGCDIVFRAEKALLEREQRLPKPARRPRSK